ncbi:hypothetical protein FA13DRAFT_1810198 [Coprinellus micaceus]|uniref:F-box domain-containing protein n=1 Tax=Coprinellus micaceus TaxID=71717 RepID=A0A4Y7TQS8_COPMI|nr:hypothetical protein FA13DRAFT_1810198 [Coprinellus micaceus]
MFTLPPELACEILQRAWATPMPVRDRRSLISCWLRVSYSWAMAFLEIMGSDVHILDRAFMEYYFQLHRGDSILFKLGKLPQIIDSICHSMTLHISNPSLPSHPCTTEPEAEKLLSDILYRIKLLSALPNLKRLKVLFQNVSCEDVFQYHRLVDFPTQVEQLELEYTFTVPIPHWMIPMPHFFASGSNPSWTLPSVKHLRIKGGFEDLMKTVFVCPKITSFEMDSCLYWDRKSKRDVKDCALIRTLFFQEPVKSGDAVLTYHWWLSHDFALGDITDDENVQYIACKVEEVRSTPDVV